MAEGTVITESQAAAIASMGGAITLIEDGAQNIEAMRLDDDDEIAAIKCMPLDWRMRVTGRLIELTASLRESVVQLDTALLSLTGGRTQ